MPNPNKDIGIHTSFAKLVAHCLLRVVVASVMAFILYASFTTIAVGSLTEEIGYTVLYSEDGENYDEVYKHYIADGEDKLLDKYIDKKGYYQTPIRSSLTATEKTVVMWLANGISLAVLFGMIYALMWNAGDANANRAELGGAKPDHWRGVKVALCAMIPAILAYLYLLLAKSFDLPGGVALYKVVTYYGFAINETFLQVGDTESVLTATSALGLLINLLPLPLFAAFGYRMGEKHLIFKEKIMYQKDAKKKEQNNG